MDYVATALEWNPLFISWFYEILQEKIENLSDTKVFSMRIRIYLKIFFVCAKTVYEVVLGKCKKRTISYILLLRTCSIKYYFIP